MRWLIQYFAEYILRCVSKNIRALFAFAGVNLERLERDFNFRIFTIQLKFVNINFSTQRLVKSLIFLSYCWQKRGKKVKEEKELYMIGENRVYAHIRSIKHGKRSCTRRKAHKFPSTLNTHISDILRCLQKKIGFLFSLGARSCLRTDVKNDPNHGRVRETCYNLHCDRFTWDTFSPHSPMQPTLRETFHFPQICASIEKVSR